jgi:hypothetical protein
MRFHEFRITSSIDVTYGKNLRTVMRVLEDDGSNSSIIDEQEYQATRRRLNEFVRTFHRARAHVDPSRDPLIGSARTGCRLIP